MVQFWEDKNFLKTLNKKEKAFVDFKYSKGFTNQKIMDKFYYEKMSAVIKMRARIIKKVNNFYAP